MSIKRITFIFACIIMLGFTGTVYGQDSDEYFVMAKKEGHKQNFAKATEYCEKANELAPLDMDIKEYLGKCYIETKQLDKARSTLLEVLQKSPDRTDARHYLINIDTQQKRYSSAVCYVNELLEITPYSKTLWKRKIGLYNLMDNRVEANRETKRLYQIFPEDKEIKEMYNNVLKEDALKMTKGGDIHSAASGYEEALRVNNKDLELYLGLISLQIKAGEFQAALATADRGLNALPGNSELIKKKVSILEYMQEYQKAIDLVQQQLKKGQSAYYNDLLIYLTSEAARFYKNADPYELYGQLYERDKSNKEAQTYLLNTSISRGYFGDAQAYLSRALKSNPNSKELLSKQLYVYESQQNLSGARGTIEKLYKLYPQDADIRAKYDAITFQEAKANYAEENYQEALPVFVRLANHPEYGKSANNYLYSMYLDQKSYDKAMEQVDKLISAYPSEQDYVLKKIDLLAAMQQYEDAYAMALDYYKQNPDSTEYRSMLGDIGIEYIKYLNTVEDYGTIKQVSDEMKAADPDNELAYNYGIGARISMAEFDDAMVVLQEARKRFPESKELRLKEAGLYSESGQHEQAIAVLQQMMKDYPYNSTIKNSLVDEMLLYARQREEKEEFTEAMAIYNEILLIKPADSVAPIKLANIHLARKEYTDAMAVADKALLYNKGNQDLLYLKGQIYEEMGDYKMAKEYQSKYIPPAHKIEEHRDHLDFLDSRMLKNQAILSYMDVSTDSLAFNTSVATFEYLRFAKRDTYVARVNYAARNSGVGLQGEADWYHNFKNKSYFLINAGVSGKFFPKYKLGGSFFQPFRKSWQAEFGIRYQALQDDTTLLTGVLGIEKTFDHLWLNARALFINGNSEMYNSLLVQSRFYMNNNKDYAMAMASVGNAPEDQRMDFQISNFLSFATTMVGGGYYHFTSNRTSFGIVGNWYNYRISQDYYINQYNVYIAIRTRF
jgi:YaiO family outer membrane protein